MAVKYVTNWAMFKKLALELHPQTIFYLEQPHPLRTPPLGLRLTFYHNQSMYVFIDYANGASLVKTRIPVKNHTDKIHAEVREEDIRDFLSNNFPGVKLVSLPPFIYGSGTK